jgi:transcriptional regulator with XRE-family HTH domain
MSTNFGEMADALDDLPRLLHNTRSDRDMTIREVARITGISKSTLFNIEAGNREASAYTAKAIFRWLHTLGSK